MRPAIAYTLFRLAVAIAIAVFPACPTFAQDASAARIRVGGTGSGSVLLQRLAEKYRRVRPEVRIDVVMPPLGSNGGLRSLAAHRIDVVVLGWLPDPQQRSAGLVVVPWVQTPLVLATSNGKKASGFSSAELAAILRNGGGKWDDGSRINLVLRHPKETESILLATQALAIKAAQEVAQDNRLTTFADTDLDAVDLLELTPGSLGITTLGLLKLKGSFLSTLSLNGVAPSLPTLSRHEYPLVKTLYLGHDRSASRPVTDFVTWLKSSAVTPLLLETGHLVPMQ